MATLAEQRRDDQPKSTDSNHTLNTSKADGHISTQESLNELNRQPQILPPNVLQDGNTSHLIRPIARSGTMVEITEASRTPASTSTTRTKPFVLSSRADFDEENIFAAARERISSKANPTSPHAQNGVLCEDNNQRNDASEILPNTPPQSYGLRVHTPTSKAARYMFKRTFDATFNPSGVHGTDIVLASDSGEDSS